MCRIQQSHSRYIALTPQMEDGGKNEQPLNKLNKELN